MRPKLEDVAKRANVSKTTVSRVLNNRGYLSQKTIDNVYKAIEELNYQPNVVARQLFQKKTNIVGLLFPTVANPFFSELVEALEKKLYEIGYKVLIGNSMNNKEKETNYLNQLLSDQVDGLIVGTQNENLDEYDVNDLSIVAIDKIINEEIPVISSDNYQGGLIATQTLIERGARNIILTDGPLSIKSPAHKRREAYEAAMKQHGLKPEVFLIDFSWSTGEKVAAIKKMLVEHPNIDAVFATNDIDAAMIWQIAEEMGKEIPKDLKIIGYDHAQTTGFLLPKLTSIKQPIEEMATAAVKALLGRMKHKSVDKKQVFPVKLWPGESI